MSPTVIRYRVRGARVCSIIRGDDAWIRVRAFSVTDGGVASEGNRSEYRVDAERLAKSGSTRVTDGVLV